MLDLFGNHIVGFPTRRLKWRMQGYGKELAKTDITEYRMHNACSKERGKKMLLINEPWENQQCGFLTGLTKTDLYSHRKELES